MNQDLSKKYANGEVTIVWKPALCIHSTICWKMGTGLPEVFNPREKPWIKPEAATSQQMVDQVKKCPSGALSFFYNNQEKEEELISADTRIEVLPKGPLLVYGNIVVKDSKGQESRKSKVTAFCRCGQSRNKPFCDGSHITTGFEEE